MKNKMIYYGVIALLILNILLVNILYRKNRNNSFLNNKLVQLKTREHYKNLKNKHYLKVISWIQKANQISLAPNLKIKNENGDKVALSQLIGKNPKLVFKYSELNCNVCVDSQLVFVKKFIKKHGVDNLIMISSYKYPKSIYQFKLLNDIENEIYNIEMLDSSLAELNIPYYFVIDSSFKPKMIHFPEKIIPEDTREYFKTIENKYFKGDYKGK